MAKRAKPGKRPAPRLSWIERLSRWLVFGLVRLGWWLGLRVGVVAALVLGGATLYAYANLPAASDLLDGRDRGSVTLRDRDGQVFAWRGAQFQTIDVARASPHLVNAVLATEDKRFHRHFGLDLRGIARALVANIRAGRVVQGGSTITQQVAKLLFFENTRSLERHIKQLPIVLAMEAKYTKDEILSIYLNRAYLGAGAQGFEAAAARYFGKSAADVTPAEAAMLAGLLRAPSRFAPTNDLARARNRASVVLGLMEAEGHLSPVEAALARAEPAVLTPRARGGTGAAFADWVMEAGPSFLTGQTSEDVEIRTSFDPAAQRAAERAVAEVFRTKVRDGSRAEVGVVVLTPDGAVRGMVGGRSGQGRAGRFNRATQALRQPGSAFKPFVYAAALTQGARPTDRALDAPLTLQVRGSGPWSPQNYTREFRGEVMLTEALAQSINTVAVRLSEEVGRSRVRAMAADFGITTPLADTPSLALGVSEVTLLELTAAYAGFLNGGVAVRPHGLLGVAVRGDQVPLMAGETASRRRVIDEKAAGYLVHMLEAVVTEGTGGRASLGPRPAAGKTGTTQAARDAWFVGFTADYVVGVWMGYDDNTPLRGVTGGGLPAEIWRETMLRLHEGLPVRPLPALRPPPPAPPVPSVASTLPSGQQERSVLQEVISNLLGRRGGG